MLVTSKALLCYFPQWKNQNIELACDNCKEVLTFIRDRTCSSWPFTSREHWCRIICGSQDWWNRSTTGASSSVMVGWRFPTKVIGRMMARTTATAAIITAAATTTTIYIRSASTASECRSRCSWHSRRACGTWWGTSCSRTAWCAACSRHTLIWFLTWQFTWFF